MKILGISGSLSGSKTLTSVKKCLEVISQHYPEHDAELLDLKNFDVEFCRGVSVDQYNDDTRSLIEIVSSADAYIIGTPVFQGSFTGALKNVFDLCDPKVFRNKVMAFIATGGTYQHYLMIENQLKPIAGYFRSFVAPGSVYLHSDHFDVNGQIVDVSILKRFEDLAHEVVKMNQFSQTIDTKRQTQPMAALSAC